MAVRALAAGMLLVACAGFGTASRAACPPPSATLRTAQAVLAKPTPALERNVERIRAAAATGSYRAVAFGDSNMAGWPQAMLSDALGRPSLNAGVGGGTQTIIWELDAIDFSHLSPDLVFLMVGSNNLQFPVCDIFNGILADVRAARSRFPKARIVVAGVVPGGAGFQDRQAVRAALNKELQAGAGAEYAFVDFTAPIESACENRAACQLYHPDMIHWSKDGYAAVGRVLNEFVSAQRG